MSTTKGRLLIALVALAAILAAPVNAQDMDLVSGLVSQLGISEAQAIGGVQAILGATKKNLSPSDYSSLIGGAPSLGKLAEGMGSEAAGSATGAAVGGDMAASVSEMAASASDSASSSESAGASSSLAASASEMAGAAGDSMGGMDLSSLSKLTGLTSQFSELGLDAGMVQKFVPAMLGHFGKDSATSGLLMKGLGLL